MKLYALKSNDRYLKKESGGIVFVGMEKASVYQSREALAGLIDMAKQENCESLHCVMLEINETVLEEI